jgi:hypothetical protein
MNIESFQADLDQIMDTSPLAFFWNKIIGCFPKNRLGGYGWYQKMAIVP